MVEAFHRGTHGREQREKTVRKFCTQQGERCPQGEHNIKVRVYTALSEFCTYKVTHDETLPSPFIPSYVESQNPYFVCSFMVAETYTGCYLQYDPGVPKTVISCS